MTGARFAAVAALAAGACTGTQRPSPLDVATLAASTASIALDWRQTRGAAAESWSDGRLEAGWAANMIGTQPSPRAVDDYFAAAVLCNAALWAMLPRNWRSVIPGWVIGVETSTVVGNLHTTHF